MRPAKWLLDAVLLTASVVSALADLTVAQAAASHSSSPDLVSSTLVLRGSTDAPEQVAAASDGGAPTVLRGSPPSAAQPHASPYACNPGLYFNYGCVAPGRSYAPDYGLIPVAAVAGSATALPTVLAGGDHISLVRPSLIRALLTASPVQAGSAADNRSHCFIPIY